MVELSVETTMNKGAVVSFTAILHVCNPKVNGKACALSHSFHSHQGTTKAASPSPQDPSDYPSPH